MKTHFSLSTRHIALKRSLIIFEPAAPVIRESEKSRFEMIVKLYFTGDALKSLLGN